MTNHLFTLFIIAFAFSSCDNAQSSLLKGKKPIIADKPFPKDKYGLIDIPPPPAPYTGPKKFCFEMELGKNIPDMTRMQFILDDNDSIHGRLDYSFTDHTPLHGTIKGIKEGEFIELNYMYTDNGQNKQEQLILKLEGNNLYKKNGAMVEEGGRMVLENPLKASFRLFLMKVDCK